MCQRQNQKAAKNIYKLWLCNWQVNKVQLDPSTKLFSTESTQRLRNSRNVKHWMCTDGGMEMSMTSLKLSPAFRGAESPQLLPTSHGIVNIQHFTKKNSKSFGKWSRWETKLCLITDLPFLFYCNPAAAFLFSLWSPQILIWDAGLCTSD